MAQHVDNAVFERRLRPIYDNLECNNNRKALQESEKLLKKHPNLLCARALKGLSLMRLGRYEESHSCLQLVAEEKPTDDSTLQVLSFCYREMEQLDKIVELYQHAVKKNPLNEELLAHLFVSYVRVEDYKSQQAVALQLFKVQPKNAYYFWAVMSIVLQGIRGPESKIPEKRKIYLGLAQRMVDKLLQENKLETEQEVYLYLHILKLQDKNEEALEFLNGEVCQKLFPGVPITIKFELFKALGKWQEMNALLKNLLRNDPDRWDYYQEYLSSCFELLKLENLNKENDIENEKEHNSTETMKESVLEPKEDSNNVVAYTLDECVDFLNQIIETADKRIRGPYLARLELHQRMRAANMDAQALLGDFKELIAEYFNLFGHKSCCTHDISLFLPSISLDERLKLATILLRASGTTPIELPQSLDLMQKHICSLQIARICGAHIDVETEHLMALSTAMKLHYEHGLSKFSNGLLATEMGPSDPYALLAANVMYDVSLRRQASDELFQALCLLQYVVRNSTSNFHAKLLSLKIFHMFGCLLGAQEMYEFLDIKQIQMDSMGYVHCNLLPQSGRASVARSLYDSTLKFFTNCYKERLEYIALTFRFCTFSKMEEFMDFKERLTNSLHFASITVEAQICDMVMFYGSLHQNLSSYQAMNIEPTTDRISWHELSDNRDLSAMINWDPLHLVNKDEERKASFEEEVEVLQIRQLQLRLFASFIDLYHPPSSAKLAIIQKFKPNVNKSSTAAQSGKVDLTTIPAITTKDNDVKETTTIELLRDEWVQTFKRLRTKTLKPLKNRFLVNLLPTRLHLLLDMCYEKFFNDLALLVLHFYNGDQKLIMQCKTVCDNVCEIVNCLTDTIRESDAASDSLWFRREWQQKVSASIEMLSLYAFLLAVLLDKIQVPTKTKPRRKGADENHGQTISENERSQLLIDLMRQLKHKFETVDSIIRKWKAPKLPRDLNSFMADMSLTAEVETTLISDVSTTFRESHELMVTDFRNLIKDKIRMVSKC